MLPLAARPRKAVVVQYRTTEPRTNQHTRAIGDENDHALRGGTKGLRRLAIHVNLSRNKEEVVADAMQQDAKPEHPDAAAGVAQCKEDITNDPCEHACRKHVLHAEPAKEP